MSRGSVSHNYEYVPGFSNALQNIASTRLMLKIRQQPIQTRLSTNNERDRRPLDPPPIVQIELENSNIQETQDFLQNPYLFMGVSLVHSVTHEDVISNTQNTLSGQTVSSMYKLKDINNHDGGFFVFGDLSVKLEGQFRLKFSMFEISHFGASSLKSIYSDVFQVYSSKTFPGMLESTFLSRSFSDQGVRIRIRKEHRVQIAGSRKRKLSSSHDDISDMIDHDRYYHVQSPSMLAPSPLNNDFHTFDQQRRRSSAMSEGRRPSYPAVDRRPSVPFSPPHQTYDHYRHPMEYDKGYYYHHQQQMMIPSPPPSLLKSNDFRRLSMEDRTPLRRQSADSYYSTHPYEPRRLSLQHTTKEEVIHLPPLRSVIASGSKPQEGVVEVNAAVAMMELSTRQQQNK